MTAVCADYNHLPSELRPPTLVREVGVHHYNNETNTYVLNVDDEYDYASSDEYEENENENENENEINVDAVNEELYENIYKNKTEFVTEDNNENINICILNCDYYDDEEDYANDDIEYSL